MTYTEDQKNIISEINTFQKQNEKKTCLLDAPGGVGKTFTIAHYNKTALYLTPTNQAKKVLQKQNIYNVFTIARFLKMDMEYTEDGIEKPVYKGYDSKLLGDSNLIIVDECSMLTKDQVYYLLKVDVHILFCGDRCQLSPIKCDKVMSEVFYLDHYSILSLTKNIRTDNLHLQSINNHYRNVVKQIKSIKPNLSNNLIDQEKVKDLFEIDKDIRLVTYTNPKVNKWNDLIRKKLYPTNYNQRFVIGEKLIVNDFIATKELKYYTGDNFIIEELEIVNKVYIHRFCKCGKCEKYIPRKYKDLDEIQISIQTFEITNNENKFYYPVDEKNMKLLYKVFATKKCIIQNSTGDKKDKWKNLYNWWKTEQVPLIYPYATTIHKAQGSGFDTVIFDTTGLYHNDQSRKLRYVAVSRAKKELFIVQ